MAMAGNDTSKVCPLTFHALDLSRAADFKCALLCILLGSCLIINCGV